MSRSISPRLARFAIAAMFFANGMGFANWVSRIPAVRQGLGLSDGELGTALFAIGAGALLAFRLTGRWNSLWGARRLTLGAALAYCLLLPGPALVGSLPSLMLMLFLFGVANGAMDVSMNAVAVEVEAFGGKPVMSVLHGMWSVGGLTGSLVGSSFAKQDLSPAAHLGGVAVLLAVLVVAMGRFLPPSPKREAGPDAHFVRPDAAMLGLGAIICCAFLIEGAMADWSAVYLHDGLGANAAVAALGYAAFSLAMVVMRFAGDALATRWSEVLLLRVTGGAAALALGAALVSQRLGLTLAAFCLTGIGVASVAPLVFRAAARRSTQGASRGIAAMATLGYGGFLIGPPAIGWLAEATSLRMALGLLAVLALAMALLAHHLREPA